MTKLLSMSFALTVLLAAADALAGHFATSVQQYRAAIVAAHAVAADSNTLTYLQACLTGSDQLRGIEIGDASLPKRLWDLVDTRRMAAASLPGDTAGNSALQMEDEAYMLHLFPYVSDEWCWLLSLQAELQGRKYFTSEAAENASFVESLFKKHCALGRNDPTADLSDRRLGIAPWEAMVRVEPTLAFDEGPQVAVLGTVGLSYTFFPCLDRSPSPPTLDESFASRYVQKTGVRIGVGAGRFDGHTQLLMGTGVQLNAIAVWCLYEPADEVFMIAVSAADLTRLKSVIGWLL